MGSTVFATVTTPGPPGPTGPPGYTPKYIVAPGAPPAGTGNDGDMYINSSTGDVYGPKSSGSWGGIQCNIKGPTGATGAAGAAGYSPVYIVAAGIPSAGVGNNNDMYINSTTSDVYGPKTAGAWGAIQCNIKGATGATGATGPPGVAYTPKGAWSAATTYAQGDEVTSSSQLYISLQAANLNNPPSSSPTWWQLVGSGSAQTPWLSDIDGATFTLKNVGKVGIAVAAPLDILHVHAGTDLNLRVRTGASINGTGGVGLDVLNDANTVRGSLALAGNPIQLTGGSVGIATGTPICPLEVVGPVSNPSLTTETSIFSVTNHSTTSTQLGIGMIQPAPNTVWLQARDVLNRNIPYPIGLNPLGGNVGVGTTSPTSTLSLVGGGSSGNANDATLNYNAPNTVQFASGVPGVSLAGGVMTASPNAFWLQVRSSNANGNSYPLALNPLAGFVGIGTSAPSNTLDVFSATQTIVARFTSASASNDTEVHINSAGTGIGYAQLAFDDRGSALWGVYKDSANNFNIAHFGQSPVLSSPSAGNALYLMQGGGNVGIGQAPSTILDIYGASDTNMGMLRLISNGNNPAISFYTASGNANARHWQIATNYQAYGNLDFMHGSAPGGGPTVQAMSITYQGYVGIGIATPSGPLHVYNPSGNLVVFMGAPAGYGTYLELGPTPVELVGTPSGDFFQNFNGGASNVIWSVRSGAVSNTLVLAGGKVAIGKSGPGYALDVVGDVNCTGVFRVNGTAIGGGITTQNNVFSTRVVGTVYQNTTGKPLFVNVIDGLGNNHQLIAYTDASTTPTYVAATITNTSASTTPLTLSFWVLPGNYYKVLGSGTVTSWTEWY